MKSRRAIENNRRQLFGHGWDLQDAARALAVGDPAVLGEDDERWLELFAEESRPDLREALVLERFVARYGSMPAALEQRCRSLAPDFEIAAAGVQYYEPTTAGSWRGTDGVLTWSWKATVDGRAIGSSLDQRLPEPVGLPVQGYGERLAVGLHGDLLKDALKVREQLLQQAYASILACSRRPVLPAAE